MTGLPSQSCGKASEPMLSGRAAEASSVWQESVLTSAAAVTITVGAEVVVVIIFTLETRKGPLWCRRVSSAVAAFTVPDPRQGHVSRYSLTLTSLSSEVQWPSR